MGFANDVWKTGDLEAAQKKRGKEFINKISNRVSDHMFGSGYAHQLGVKRAQFKSGTSTRKTGRVTKRKKTKSKGNKKKKKKAAPKKKKKPAKKKKTRRTKQDIQDIFS